MADAKTEKQKVQEITEKLEQGIKELFESEKYKTYLNTMSKFHNYSFNNTMLIAMQKPDATLVAGFKAWQKNFDRHVKKGEKGIRILAPAPYKIKEEQEKLDPITGEIMLDKNGMPITEEVEIKIPAFRVVPVFDVSQTDGKELPDIGVNELSGSVEDYEDFMQALTEVSPVPITYEDIEGEAKGYFHTTDHRIAIQEGMSQSQTVKTAIHEVAHAKLHDRERNQDIDAVLDKDRNTKEVEAESVAYTVCQHFGIDTSDYSFGYIAGWSSDRDMKELKSSLDTIRKTASELITGIEDRLAELQKDRAVEQGQELEESLANREAQLLFGGEDRFGIYQLKDTEEARDIHFMGMDYLESKGIAVTKENYDLVYVGELSKLQGQSQGETLEAVYEKFNIDHPEDFRGHSLSVSDVVVLHQNGENSAHFVDSFGFTGLPDFMRELEGVKEQETEKAEDRLTDGEKHFLETDNAPLIAKKFLAWDEIEDLGYRFFEDGYIDKFKPSEKALYGDGMVPELEIYDIARRMQGGEDIREELAKALIGGHEQVTGVGENDAVAVFGKDAVTDTFGNAKKQISYEEIGTAFLSLIENEYKDIEQARAAEEHEEEIAGNTTFGHDVQKLKSKQTEQDEPKKSTETLQFENTEDGDEIIDLGDEADQVLAEMKKSLTGEQETELAFQIADRFISIQETEGGYDYSIMGADYKEIDGGVYDNPDVTIREALDDIVTDLKENPFDNGARGNISDKDELIPIDYDGLMEKGAMCQWHMLSADRSGSGEEAADRIESQAQESVVENFKAKTNELFHEISEMNPAEIEETVKCHVQAEIDETGIDAEIVDAVVVGSRCRGLEREGSDLDVVVELSTDEREDVLFDMFNEAGLHIGGVKVDINPITAQRTGTLETYLPQVEDYLEGVRKTRENDPAILSPKQTEPEVTLTVAECGEFHNMGEFYENIPTVEEAVAIWKQIPPERMNGISAIGVNIHIPGMEAFEDVGIDILSGKRIDLDILEHIPEIKGNPQAMEVIAELAAKLPEMEIDGYMSEKFEAKVWEKRMPDLEPAGQLAVELDRFVYDYDKYSYRNDVQSMTENVTELTEMLEQGDTEHITEWLNEAISEGTAPEEEKRAKELLEKLAEYKPLAKVEEMEEQNYNMVDNVLNNGAGEKAQKEENKKEQERPAARTSLKARLAEKKALVSGQGKDHEAQENNKNNQREM